MIGNTSGFNIAKRNDSKMLLRVRCFYTMLRDSTGMFGSDDKKSNLPRGFTLIELVLVISLIGAIFVSIVITYRSSKINQSLRTSSENFANVARNAHIFAREATNKKGWGVVKQGDTQYSLVSGRKDAWVVETNYSLEEDTVFGSEFFFWFGIGTGETSQSQVVDIQATNGKHIEVDVIKTGIVNISNIE